MKTKNIIPPHFYWVRKGKKYLVTNDAGFFARLDAVQFGALTGAGSLSRQGAVCRELQAKGFVRDRLDFEDQAAKWSGSNAYLRRGPGLHILVLTLRCNHRCSYCQAGAAGAAAGGTDMGLRVVRKSLDLALSAPGEGLTIEFQGGEPLLNWAALKEAVVYGERAAAAAGKQIKFALVSNFSLMTEEKAAFLIKHGVALCTSLDGPAELHDHNRPLRLPGGAGRGSHAATVKWIKYFQKKCGKDSDCGPSALLTVSKYSLGREKEIIDEYAGLGLSSVFIGPPAPIGFARAAWDRIGCDAGEFLGFYRKSLKRVVELNKKGVFLKEKTAFLILKKVLGFRDNKYVDLRCPCGAGLGQLAYNFNGDVYTCDEARMLAWQGDGLFKAGNVFKDTYPRIISSGAVKACAAASSLDSQPMCARCVWRPYCGTCPVYNYQIQGSLWGYMPDNGRCRILKGVFEMVFGLLEDKEAVKVFQKWLV
ncbi:MAG: His-Xaa-Ser system radical SAM maturase HxsB [Elusimicrobiota bacterium]